MGRIGCHTAHVVLIRADMDRAVRKQLRNLADHFFNCLEGFLLTQAYIVQILQRIAGANQTFLQGKIRCVGQNFNKRCYADTQRVGIGDHIRNFFTGKFLIFRAETLEIGTAFQRHRTTRIFHKVELKHIHPAQSHVTDLASNRRHIHPDPTGAFHHVGPILRIGPIPNVTQGQLPARVLFLCDLRQNGRRIPSARFIPTMDLYAVFSHS